MIISFQSLINNDGKKQEIKFTAPVKISTYKEFDVYEFREPAQNQMNRIEIAAAKINIMAGPGTLELELDKKVRILYRVGTGHIELDTLLKTLRQDGSVITFSYSLLNKAKVIGDYQIKLEIK